MAHNFKDLLGSATVLTPSSIWFSDYKCWYLKDVLTQFCNQKYKMNKIWGVWAKHTHFLSLGQKCNCFFLLLLIKKPDAMLQKWRQINYWQAMESRVKWDKDALKSAQQRTNQYCVNYPSLLFSSQLWLHDKEQTKYASITYRHQATWPPNSSGAAQNKLAKFLASRNSHHEITLY